MGWGRRKLTGYFVASHVGLSSCYIKYLSAGCFRPDRPSAARRPSCSGIVGGQGAHVFRHMIEAICPRRHSQSPIIVASSGASLRYIARLPRNLLQGEQDCCVAAGFLSLILM
jgi:hypothetical protein